MLVMMSYLILNCQSYFLYWLPQHDPRLEVIYGFLVLLSIFTFLTMETYSVDLEFEPHTKLTWEYNTH